ncbi:MAG TPA: CvpA family protein [Candidatus Limnocylindria bacterium]|nr:CvpA family protein [Candidatus Limnocylindria bacterium]
MEFFRELGVMDVFIVAILAAGVFMGFTQGLIRYALNVVVVVAAFVVASQLKVPLDNALGFWEAFTPELREQILFLFLFLALVIGGWFVVRALYQRTRLPIPRQLDELGGAVLGLLWAALFIGFLVVVMDNFFTGVGDQEAAEAGIIKGLYDALRSSALVEVIRDSLIPAFGYVVRPLVPEEIARLLEPRA